MSEARIYHKFNYDIIISIILYNIDNVIKRVIGLQTDIRKVGRIREFTVTNTEQSNKNCMEYEQPNNNAYPDQDVSFNTQIGNVFTLLLKNTCTLVTTK